jgi:hypothetical protein
MKTPTRKRGHGSRGTSRFATLRCDGNLRGTLGTGYQHRGVAALQRDDHGAHVTSWYWGVTDEGSGRRWRGPTIAADSPATHAMTVRHDGAPRDEQDAGDGHAIPPSQRTGKRCSSPPATRSELSNHPPGSPTTRQCTVAGPAAS